MQIAAKESTQRKRPFRKNSPPRIIVLDDEDCLLQLYPLLIRTWRRDAEVTAFADSEAALEELTKREPDLLITDLGRPRMNGYEMLPLLAERGARFPILVVSGQASEDNVRRFSDLPLNLSFFPKPMLPDQLVGQLVRFLGTGDIRESLA